MSRHVLRAALIWHDEVMSDIVVDKSAKVTIGTSPRATFLVPDLGLPPELVILRPGERGHVLTLADTMGGTITVDGSERDVGAFVRASGASFHATSIVRGDWGLVDLDASGAYKLFFQFVELEDRVPVVKRSTVLAGLAGHLIASAALTLAWYVQGEALDEAMFRGIAIVTIALVIGGIAWSILRDDAESKASLAFSAVLHAALLFVTYQVYDESDAFAWPERSPIADRYIVTRLEAQPTPAITSAQPAAQPETAAPAPSPAPQPSRAPESRSPGHAPDVGILQRRNRDVLDGVLGRSTAGMLQRIDRIGGDGQPGIAGDGGLPATTGTHGNGDGNGTVGRFQRDLGGPPGQHPADRKGGCVTADCKGPGEKQVGTLTVQPPTIDDDLDKKKIDEIVRSRAGLFRSCYQRQLDHGHPDLAGDIVTKFVIGGDGVVKSAVVIGGRLHDDDVAACVTRNLMLLRFPPKPPGGIAIYPFVFSPH